MKKLTLSILLLFFVFAIYAEKSGGTLVIGMPLKPRHLNPAVQSGIATGVPGAQLFATLIRYDNKWQPQPYLAKSWKFSDDGLSLTVKLRENAKFHDGKAITSKDVAFSIETIKANHPFKTMFAPVKKVDTPDQYTAILRLDKPHPAILLALSSVLGVILPQHVYGDGHDLKTHPANSKVIGSGPYQLVTFEPGVKVVLKKFDDFFLEGKPKLDRIIMQIFKNTNSATLALDKGEIDMFPFLTNIQEIELLKRNDNLTVFAEGYEAVGPLNWLAFNTTHEILKNKKVRQAIAYAIDRKFIVNALHRRFSKENYGPIHHESPYAVKNPEKYDLDLKKANALLDEAGFPKEDKKRFSLTLDFIPGALDQQKAVAEYIKPALKKVGIDIIIRNSPDFPSWAKRISTHNFALTMDIVFNWGDPVIGVHRTYLCSNIIKGVIWTNTQSYCNKEVDQLLTDAATETDQEKRTVLYQKAQEIIIDEIPIYFLNSLPYHTGVRNNVINPPVTIWGTMAPLLDTSIE